MYENRIPHFNGVQKQNKIDSSGFHPLKKNYPYDLQAFASMFTGILLLPRILAHCMYAHKIK